MSSLAELLTPDLKLDDLEASLAAGTKEPQETVMSAIDKVQGSILPMRLQFNDFLQTMSSLDDLQDQTPLEKFTMIRSKVLDLTNRLQMISEDVGKLQPLFDTIPEYSERYGTKKFQPLETLRITSQNSTISTPQTQNSGTSNPPASRKINKSSGGTPVSHASTPLGSVAPSTFPAAGKKPRKPRQSKRVQAVAAAAADTVKGQPSVLSPTPPAHMMTSAPPPMQMMNSVVPNNMMGSPMQSLMSPVGNTPNGYGLPQQQMQLPQSQQPPQQFNQPAVGNSAPPVQPLNMNSITPANILNMSLASDPQQQQPVQRKNFDPLDFNNLDFGDLNMDMI